MTEPKFETCDFTCDATTHLSIIEPAQMPQEYGGPVYLVKHENICAKSKFQPLIFWGEKIEPEMPFAWCEALGRCKTWRIGLSRFFLGSKLSVRIGVSDAVDHRSGQAKVIKSLIAVHVHNEKPTDEAKQWLKEQIVERRGWFK